MCPASRKVMRSRRRGHYPDFDNLLVVNILRYGAPEAFDFLVRKRNTFLRERQLSLNGVGSDETARHRNRVQQEWQQATDDVEWDVRAALRLIQFLLPGARSYFEYLGSIESAHPQGITHERYWRRITNEECDEGDVKDQAVICDVESWLANRNAHSPMIEQLLTSTGYRHVWGHIMRAFGRRIPPLEFSGQINERLLGLGRNEHVGSSVEAAPHPAFWTAWQYAKSQQLVTADVTTWLVQQVHLAVPLDLSLTNALYYDWASDRDGRVLDNSQRATVRQAIYETSQRIYQSGQDLLAALRPGMRYEIAWLVFPIDNSVSPSAYRNPADWRWLGPILLDGLQRQPERLALSIAHLISVAKRDPFDHVAISVMRDEVLRGIFGDNAAQVIRLLAGELNRTEGEDRRFLEQVVNSAEQLLGGEPRPVQESNGTGQ